LFIIFFPSSSSILLPRNAKHYKGAVLRLWATRWKPS